MYYMVIQLSAAIAAVSLANARPAQTGAAAIVALRDYVQCTCMQFRLPGVTFHAAAWCHHTRASVPSTARAWGVSFKLLRLRPRRWPPPARRAQA